MYKDNLVDFMIKSDKKSKRKKPVRSAKQEKVLKNLLKIVEQFMTGKSFIPLTAHELMQRLALPPQHEPLLLQVLEQLIAANLIESIHERYAWKKLRSDLAKGIIKVHPRGFGFVHPHSVERTTDFSEDIFIPKHLTKNAVDGDEVEILINPESFSSEKGPEGRVIAILARTHSYGRHHSFR